MPGGVPELDTVLFVVEAEEFVLVLDADGGGGAVGVGGGAVAVDQGGFAHVGVADQHYLYDVLVVLFPGKGDGWVG